MPRNSEGSRADQPLTGMARWNALRGLVPDGESMAVVTERIGVDIAEVEIIHRDYPGLVVSLKVDREGRVRAVGLEPAEWTADVLDAAPEITARLLRSVPLGQMHVAARAMLQDHTAAPSFRHWADVLKAAPRPGKRGRPDSFYAELAADYCDALTSSTPVKDLAKAASYSESQIRNLLYEARRRGLLTESPGGRAGGTLTEKAVQLLRKGDHDGER